MGPAAPAAGPWNLDILLRLSLTTLSHSRVKVSHRVRLCPNFPADEHSDVGASVRVGTEHRSARSGGKMGVAAATPYRVSVPRKRVRVEAIRDLD